MDLILPAEVLQIVQDELQGASGAVRFAKVIISLKDIVDGDFFNTYIKKGVGNMPQIAALY